MIWTRRTFCRAGVAGALWTTLSAHSPYRQWEVYRKSRLVVLVSASEEPSVQLGTALAALYAERLPASKATLARAADTNDLVRLLASKQLDVALLREPDAFAVYSGTEPFTDNGKLPLRALATLGDYVFICRDDLPKPSAYMLAEALHAHWKVIDPALVQQAKSPRPRKALRVPIHAGAMAFYKDHG